MHSCACKCRSMHAMPAMAGHMYRAFKSLRHVGQPDRDGRRCARPLLVHNMQDPAASDLSCGHLS